MEFSKQRMKTIQRNTEERDLTEKNFLKEWNGSENCQTLNSPWLGKIWGRFVGQHNWKSRPKEWRCSVPLRGLGEASLPGELPSRAGHQCLQVYLSVSSNLPQEYLDMVNIGSDQHNYSSITLYCGPRGGLARLKSHLLFLEVAYWGQLFPNHRY